MTVRMAQRSNWKAHSPKTSCMLMGTATAPIFAKAKVADTYSGELYSWILAGQKKMIAAACGQLVPQIAEILIAYDGRHGVRSFPRTCQWEEGPPFPSGPSLRIVGAMRSRGRHGYSAHFTMPSAANRAICSSL